MQSESSPEDEVNPSGGGADQSFQDILTQTTAGNNIKQNILAIKMWGFEQHYFEDTDVRKSKKDQ